MMLNGEEPNVIESLVNGPVEFRGSGTVQVGGPSSSFTLDDIIICESESNIRAVGLTVESSIAIYGNSSLQAAENDSINLVDGKVAIVLSANGQKTLPTLGLGLLGLEYDILPREVRIEVPVGLTAGERANFRHAVISGSHCRTARNGLN
jgi:hypothetical protein